MMASTATATATVTFDAPAQTVVDDAMGAVNLANLLVKMGDPGKAHSVLVAALLVTVAAYLEKAAIVSDGQFDA